MLSAQPHARLITPAGAQAFAARNLELLAAIENTLGALAADTRLLHAIHSGYDEIRQRLAASPATLDTDGRLQAMLDKASAACARIYQDARQRHQSACQDPALHPDDGVADAYADFTNAVQGLHDSIETLREWIATHDAVLQPTTGAVYPSPAQLFAALLPQQ